MPEKRYLKYEIVRGIYCTKKSVNKLRKGARFIYKTSPLLIYTTLRSDGKHVGISDLGDAYLIEENDEIIHIHGVNRELSRISEMIKTDASNNGYQKFLSWEGIVKIIDKFLTDNPNRILKTPERRLNELKKIERELGAEFLKNPKKLLETSKEEVIASLKIKSDAGKSLINNIYDILNGKLLKIK